MRKKMSRGGTRTKANYPTKKYQPGGNVTKDMNQPIIGDVVTPPANTTVSTPATPPVAPITSNATAQVPTMDATEAAFQRNVRMGMKPGKARRMAQKETGLRKGVQFNDVMQGINTGLDLVNKGTGIAGAISNIGGKQQYGGAKKSKFMQKGGMMSGKDLRRAKSYQMGGESGNLKKQTRKSNRAAKSYGKAASSYAAGNMKKGDRQMKRGNRISGKK
jgi:hypothetical protein